MCLNYFLLCFFLFFLFVFLVKISFCCAFFAFFGCFSSEKQFGTLSLSAPGKFVNVDSLRVLFREVSSDINYYPTF